MREVENWLEDNFESENTKNLYYKAISEFLETFGKARTADELESKIKRYIQKQKQVRSPYTVNTYTFAVISYFKDKGLAIPDEKWRSIRRRMLPKADAQTVDKAGTCEEWKRILSHMDVKGKSLFLFLLSTGARIGETLQLKESDLELDSHPPRAHIRPQYTKGGEAGRTVFMTYEAKDNIKEWLEVKPILMKKEPDEMKGLKKALKNKTGKNYNIRKGDQIFDSELVWPIASTTVRKMLARALEKTNLGSRDGMTNRYQIHVHSTRKFFRSNCGLDDALSHALMGHRGYLDKSYLRTDPEKAGNDYKFTSMSRLAIFEKHIDKATQIEMKMRELQDLGVDISKIHRAIEENPELSEEEVLTNLWKETIQNLSRPQNREFKQIDESELIDYLNQGWEVYQQLNGSTKVIVVRE